MLKIHLIFIIALYTTLTFAETRIEAYQKTMDTFVKAFNNRDYREFHQTCIDSLQKAYPPEKLKQIFEKFHTQYKKIKKLGKLRSSHPLDVIFPVYFERGKLDFNIKFNALRKVTGFKFLPYTPDIPTPDKNTVALSLPFKGKWLVLWGGDTKEQNYHRISRSQRFAFDLVIVDKNGKTCSKEGKKNTDYYAFNQEIFAPAGGVVTDVITGVRDNVPGSINPFFVLGNAVFIQHSQNEVSILAHLKLGSISVKVGDKIKAGQAIARCGNSGSSTEPHIHYHLQNTPIIQDATGIKCYFEQVVVVENDKEIIYQKYSPIKEQLISSP